MGFKSSGLTFHVFAQAYRCRIEKEWNLSPGLSHLQRAPRRNGHSIGATHGRVLTCYLSRNSWLSRFAGRLLLGEILEITAFWIIEHIVDKKVRFRFIRISKITKIDHGLVTIQTIYHG